MKVLFVTHYSELYGANRSMLALIADLKARYDVQPYVLSISDGPLRAECGQREIPFACCRYFTWLTAGKNARNRRKNIVKKLLNPWLLQKACGLVKAWKPDLIYCNSSVQDLGVRLAGRLRKPVIWHLREFGEIDYGMGCIYSPKIRRKLLEKADRLIAISSAIEAYYRKLAPNANIKKIYNGVKCFDRKAPIQAQTLETVNFCCVGVLSDGKNQLEILRAAKKLVGAGYKDFAIHFIGKGDGYEALLRKYLAIHNLESYVKFWGYQSDVAAILQDMHVGIMSSRNEAFGRVTVEYMFAQMPVIGTDSGGTPEIVVDGQTGLLYTSGDADALAEHMQALICDKEKLVAMGCSGRERALQQFTVQANTDAIYRQFLECIGG